MAETGVEQRDRSGQEGHLQQGLKRRHMTMISLGGIIGAGLFVGTGRSSTRQVRRPSSATAERCTRHSKDQAQYQREREHRRGGPPHP
jgi:hypothetical protein